MKRTFTFLLAALLALIATHATETEITTSAQPVSNGQPSWSNSNLTFQFTTTPSGATIACETSGEARGLQMGGGKGDFILTSDQAISNITNITLVASTNGTANTNSISIKVGANSISTQKLPKENNKTYTFTPSSPLSGYISINVNDKNKSVYIKSITVTYNNGSTTTSYSLTRSSNDLTMGDVKITDASGNILGTQPEEAQVGDMVYFKLTTNYGYTTATNPVTVTNTTANTTITPDYDNNTGIYSFTMPAGNVSIAASFVVYHPTLKLGGLVNGSTWIDSASDAPAFTYDSTNDKYTISAYFTGNRDEQGTCDYFFLFEDGTARYPSASGNFWITSTDGTATSISLTGSSSNNFRIVPGVYDIEINGNRNSIKVTQRSYTLSFSPAAGEVEQGTSVSAGCQQLVDDIAAINSSAEVTVGVNTDNGSTWNENVTLNTVGSTTVYGKASIGNLAITGSAAYTVVKANLSKKFVRINNISSLIPGKKYIVVCEASNMAWAGSTGYGDNIVIESGETTLSNDSEVNVLTLGGTTDEYYFHFSANGATNYLYSQGDKGGSVYSNTLLSDNSKWKITFDGNNATMQNVGSGNYLRAYSTEFRAYTGKSNSPVQLYMQAKAGDYTISYAEAAGGTATGVADADEGDVITVTVTPNSGYVATGITVNPSVQVTDNGNGTYSFTMPASNVTVTPTFEQAYSITYVAEPAAGGTVTGVAQAVEGSPVVINVTPNDDYQISSVVYSWGSAQSSVNVPIIDGKYQITMPGSATTVTATFTKIPHGISVVSSHGDVTGLPATATSGTQVTFTVTPNAGYVVSSVTGTFNGGNSSLSITDNGNGTYTFYMPASDVAITVTYFASEEYEVLTDLADINTEDTYLIVGGPKSGTNAGEKTYVMGTTGSGQANGVELTSSNYDSTTGIITSTADMAIVNFVINNGNYALHTAKGYLDNTSGSNNLTYSSTPAYATITMGEDGLVDIELVDNSSKGYLSFNTSGSMWKFYGSSQGANYIFKLANKNKVKRPSITGAAGEFLGQYNFIGKDNVSMACATDGATIEYSLDGGNTWQSYSEAFEISTGAAGNTVDVMARATKTGMEPSDAVTATFTCIKPTAPTFGTNEAGAYVNPVFVYPKSALKDRRAYGEQSVSFCYTTDGTDADASSVAVAISNSNGYYIVLDDNATLSVVTVINGIASDPAGGEYTFSVDAPAFSLAGGSYDGNQQTRLSTGTKTQQNNLSWNTVFYYTTGNTDFAFNATTGEVTSEGWTAYDPTNSPYIDILAANGTTTIKAVTLSNYFNGQSEYRASDVTTETYVLTAANLAVTVSPAAGTYVNAQSVTLGVKNEIGDYLIYYTTDGSDPSANGTEYTGTPITVDHDMTIKVYAMDSRSGDGGTATAEATYKIGIQPVVYSPFPGTIYKGDDEDINVEMFSVTPNAKIYYTVAEGEGNYPDDPTTASTLYSTPVPLETGKTYNFKAIAVVGSLVSTITPGTFTVQAKGSGWLNVKEMNEETGDAYKYFDNPVQVVYMSTWRHNGEKPEFAFVRDNSGYGMVYFGGSGVNKYNDYTKYQMGDWLPGGSIKGQASVWSDSFINELGNSSGTVSEWPETALGNTAILPEETTNKAITDGWTYEGAYNGTKYANYIDPDKNLFGHYVHLRKNTISNLSQVSQKYLGQITDQSGVPLNYYDGLYLFSGHNGRPTYDQTFFDQIQNNGGTFDVYAIVYFYGPNAHNATYSNAPYEIFPIDFEWIYKPLFNINPEETTIYHEPQTISLTCETEGAQIWYKTSEMEAFELYTGPFEVDATTTIESYSTLPSKYNDVLESVINSITVTIGTVEPPVITEPSVVKTVGESVTTDITCETEGATIYYTTDGSDPKTSETRQEYTLGQQLTFDQTTTVRAISMQDGYYSVEAESRTYTFVKSNGIEYTLVTNASQLNENSVYVIVNKAHNMAMGTTQKTSNRDAAGVMFKNENKTIVYGNDDLAQFTLKKTGGNWYLQTNNSSENGYLYVAGGNTLLTEAVADGNAEATITIDGTNADVDKANEAHISFIYNNETTRYLRYWNRDHLFSTYTTETNQPVFLYYKEATPLAVIEKDGQVGTDYTIADQLLVVHADGRSLWCKDQGNVSIAKTEAREGQTDYMKQATGRTADWDQSNWVELKFNESYTPSQVGEFVGKYIKPATLTATLDDKLNYSMTVKSSVETEDGEAYEPNTYCTVNFLEKNLNLTAESTGPQSVVEDNGYYFFLNPKVQEYAKITFAVWMGNNTFVVPARSDDGMVNGNDFDGAFTVAWDYNKQGGAVVSALNDNGEGQVYQFHAIVRRTDGSAYGPAHAASTQPGKEGQTASSNLMVYPTDLEVTQEHIITAVNEVKANAEVESVTYFNVAGVQSDKPFDGINIVVTRYTDGTASTAKVVR